MEEIGPDTKKHITLLATILLMGKAEPAGWEVEAAVFTATRICNEVGRYVLDEEIGAIRHTPP